MPQLPLPADAWNGPGLVVTEPVRDTLSFRIMCSVFFSNFQTESLLLASCVHAWYHLQPPPAGLAAGLGGRGDGARHGPCQQPARTGEWPQVTVGNGWVVRREVGALTSYGREAAGGLVAASSPHATILLSAHDCLAHLHSCTGTDGPPACDRRGVQAAAHPTKHAEPGHPLRRLLGDR